MIGQSSAMRRIARIIDRIAPSSASVVITGESGTGKELVARTIHDQSPRRNKPYVAVNCAAIPDTLIESELFGHERGAFTGADRRRQGRFELANGGTLLLDEITEMKVELQAKLLRVIEEQKLQRLGGTNDIALDVRVVTASNRELKEAIREGRLRSDLYYRLAVFVIELPLLRERLEDLPLLAEHFAHEFGSANGKRSLTIHPEFLVALSAYSWPGNVRELRNAIEHAVIMGSSELLTVSDLPPWLQPAWGARTSRETEPVASLREVEREYISRVLEFTGGNRTRAARILGMSTKTLRDRVQRSPLAAAHAKAGKQA